MTDHEVSEPILGPRFDEALSYAAQLHHWQRRKGGEVPYLSHLLGVASLVLVDGGDEDEAIAALLHDAVEDQGGIPTLNEIRRRFGDRVARIVLDCTDHDPAYDRPSWEVRKKAYVDALPDKAPDSVRVSLADKLDNCRAMLLDHRRVGNDVWHRFSAGVRHLDYARALAGCFLKISDSPMAAELDRIVTELEAATQPAPA